MKPHKIVARTNQYNDTLDKYDLTTVSILDCACCYQPLTSLPDLSSFILLTNLDCSMNQLTWLPELPPNLIYLKCNNNKLWWLPELPQSLNLLNCCNNFLDCLPKLPKKLRYLDCAYNVLIELPDIPVCLKSLTCGGNFLHEIELYTIKINQCNAKRVDLGLPYIGGYSCFADLERINEQHLLWQYRIGGEKYNEASRLFN